MFVGLSIRQPWVELILQKRKSIEVRSWSTKYRGKLWLHAGQKADPGALGRFGLTTEKLIFGAIVGHCELKDCIEFTSETWDGWRALHLNLGSLEGKQFAWLIHNPVRTNPKPLRGTLGLMRIKTLPED
jgi:activating signal cointegrator 1